MIVQVNGEQATLPSSVTTIPQLLHYFNVQSPAVIVEHNETILKRQEHEQTTLADGDKLELVQFVGGG